jgi:predicted N-formylglutamate amidohydrolase
VSEAFAERSGAPGLLIVCDHASNAVPDDIDLGIDPRLLDLHIAWDIGAAALAHGLCDRFGAPGLFGAVSRLVIDLHREEDSPALIPVASDGHRIPGNEGLSAAERAARIARFFRPYHDRLGALVEATRPALIVAVHSFTPRLETAAGPARPWQVGILYNEDDRAARPAIAALRAAGFTTGDNEPYSGRLLNATMNRHAEARGIPYLAIEVRNDLIADAAGVAAWVDVLAGVVETVQLAPLPRRERATQPRSG